MHREPGLAATEKAIGEPVSRRSVNGCQRSHVFQRRTPDLLAPAIVAAIIRANHYDAFSTCLDLSGPNRLFFISFYFNPSQLPIREHAVASAAPAASYKSRSHAIDPWEGVLSVVWFQQSELLRLPYMRFNIRP
jgi:hypothetical protein